MTPLSSNPAFGGERIAGPDDLAAVVADAAFGARVQAEVVRVASGSR